MSEQLPENFFSGQGEHWCLLIEKHSQNTRWVVKELASHFRVKELAIGYCGMKDRHAVTQQWFSVHLPGCDQATFHQWCEQWQEPQCTILAMSAHHKKLHRGDHQSNRFVLQITQGQGSRELLEQRLQQVKSQGVPNYFGEQRFGWQGGNLSEANKILQEQWIRHCTPVGTDAKSSGSKKRYRSQGRQRQAAAKGGIYLSAARSYLFNLVLAERVKNGCWLESICDEDDLSAPLWGRGRSSAPPQVREFESKVLAEWQDWCTALEFSGLNQERRQLRLNPKALCWSWQPMVPSSDPVPSVAGINGDSMAEEMFQLTLSFVLPTGCFATAVLRELLDYIDASKQHL